MRTLELENASFSTISMTTLFISLNTELKIVEFLKEFSWRDTSFPFLKINQNTMFGRTWTLDKVWMSTREFSELLIVMISPDVSMPMKVFHLTNLKDIQMICLQRLEQWSTWNRLLLIKVRLKSTLKLCSREVDQIRILRAAWTTTGRFCVSIFFGKIELMMVVISTTFLTISYPMEKLKSKKSTHKTLVDSHSQCSWRSKS